MMPVMVCIAIFFSAFVVDWSPETIYSTKAKTAVTEATIHPGPSSLLWNPLLPFCEAPTLEEFGCENETLHEIEDFFAFIEALSLEDVQSKDLLSLQSLIFRETRSSVSLVVLHHCWRTFVQ